MLNREKYMDKLIDMAVENRTFALINGKPALCESTECDECDFYHKIDRECKSNAFDFREWLNLEYAEPDVDWSKVEVDTPILVRHSESNEWDRRYFAKYENEMVYAWEAGATSWSAGSPAYITDWKYAKLTESEG